jgi:hypothetical protein
MYQAVAKKQVPSVEGFAQADSDLILENMTPCYLGAGGQDGKVGGADTITLI